MPLSFNIMTALVPTTKLSVRVL